MTFMSSWQLKGPAHRRPGSLNYDNENGVLVATRVSPMPANVAAEPVAPVPAQTAKSGSQQPMPLGYGYGGY